MHQEHYAVRAARNSKDIAVLIGGLAAIAGMLLVFFGLALFVVIMQVNGYMDAGYDEYGEPIDPVMDFGFTVFGYLIIAVIVLGFTMITIRMMRQMNLGNALQVEYSDYAWLRDWANRVAIDLQMPRVEIFITQDPVINAYAFGFAKPYNIVLNSGSIRYLSRDELKTIVVHEMAHVKYHHTQITTYLSALRSFPVAGALFSWILDFWGRRTELTADRLALAYLGDSELVKNALIKVHVGPDVASSFNDVARQWQVYNSNNSFNQFTQTFSSHPFLVRRLQHIDAHLHLVQQSSHSHKPQSSSAEKGHHATT